MVIDEARTIHRSPFSVVQATWNLREGTVGPALARAHDDGWVVVVKEALANGELAEADPGGEVAVAAAGLPLDAFALGAARAQPGVDIVLSGASTQAQLERGVASGSVHVNEETRRRLAVDPEMYWRQRSARAWR
ncbi:hypothetical protein [Microbacterium sp.]|uniref:hypothetical protein n=1 Tax=Microbacterium sp. TaxID=51671 RepID=UPI0025DCD5BD|nr:hypothetical protein [Microbacterium sp.]